MKNLSIDLELLRDYCKRLQYERMRAFENKENKPDYYNDLVIRTVEVRSLLAAITEIDYNEIEQVLKIQL